MAKDNHDKQLQFLSKSIRLKETASPRLVRMTLWAASFSVLGFLAWASFADVREIAHTPGEIVPDGFQQVVQNLEGGIVREILTSEGAKVEKGQILLRLDGAGAEEDLRRASEQQLILSMQEERLRAVIENRAPQFSADALKRPDLLRDQESFYKGMIANNETEKNIIREQVAQKRQSIIGLSADLDTASRNYALAAQLFEKRQEMNRMGVMPGMRLMEAEQNYNMLQGQVRNIKSQIAAAKSAIAEYETRLAALSTGNTGDLNKQLDAVITARKQNAESLEKLKNRVARLDVAAPVAGTIKGLAVNTVGAVVQPGQVLMEIVPAGAPLIVSLKIPPRYIGHLQPGQDVQVKCSSFDFSRYGSVTGKLDFISAATFDGENGERYFQGRVRLSHPYVGENPRNTIMPGMTVMADIVTGQKTVLEYLLKPLRYAMSTAFSER